MGIPTRRMIGALILLLGVSAFAISVYTGQFNAVVEMLKTAFKTI